jgi:hypothetical protein
VNGTVSSSFFDEAAAATGLSPVIAQFTLTRLLLRAGVHGDLGPAELARALGEIEQGLRVYLPEPEVAAAMARLRALAQVEG